MSASKKRLFELILTVALVVSSVGLSQNSKVVEAADNLVLLEKRHPGYWKWLHNNKEYLDIDNNSNKRVEIFPTSKCFLNEINSEDYRIFLRDSNKSNTRRIVYFVDGTGIDVDNFTYGIVDDSTWTIVDGEPIQNITEVKYEEHSLNEINDIYQYFLDLNNTEYTFIISAKDEASHGWNESLTNLLNDLGLNGGFTNQDSYIAVVKKGKVIYEQASQEQIEYIDDYIDVKSAGLSSGNNSNIIIDGIEYSKQKRGLNIVVMKYGTVIDSVNFDTWQPFLFCNR